jgi:predicted ATP-dependent endonuclease of OLD family
MFAQLQRRTGRQIIVSSHSPEILNDSGIGNDEVLVLLPKSEGTAAQLLSENEAATALRSSGVELAEILRGLTAPEHADKLASFAS